MLKRSQYIVLGLVVLVVLVVLNLPPRAAARLKLAIGGLFLPLFGLSTASQQAAAQGAAALMPRGELVRENSRLHQENDELRLRMAEGEGILRENDRLRKLIGWQQRSPGKLKLARVVGREPSNWWRTIQIDLGTRDQVRDGLAVRTAEGLVGRILSAGLTRSQVVLVGDADCPVSAQVVETGDHGMISPGVGAPLDKSLVVLTHLPSASDLKPGQRVTTSGLGQIFPKDIPVGTIVEVRSVEFGLYREAQVKLAANLSALEEVWVMIQ